jgi:hypothetical protein
MHKLIPKIILLIFAAISLLYVFFNFFKLMSFTDPQMPLEKGRVIKIETQNTFSQEFIANHDGLANIRFLIKTENSDDAKNVKMQLADKNCSNIIREGSLSHSFLASDNLFEFKFDRIPDSDGKIFCVEASLDSQDPQAEPVRFFSHNNDPTMLSMRPAYGNSNWQQNISELNQRISQYKPWFLKHYYLYGISILFVILSIMLVIILILI